MKKIALVIFLLIPVLALAQENPGKKKAYYFYGEQCLHCKNVDEYFQANGIYDKYEITKLEVTTGNPFNQKLFLDFGKAFAKDDWGGVPTIVFADKYLVGDQPIIENFVREIDTAENAFELPKSDSIENVGFENKANQEDTAPSSNESENKKSYFSVIVIALVVFGAGALVYVNRKKR